MQTSFDRTSLVLLGVFTLFLVSPVSAEWNIDVLDQPYSFQNVSNATDTVQVIELTDGDGTPINESQLVGDSYVQYRYNGSVTEMEWLNNGYWYADFKLNNVGGQVEFEAEGETQSSLIEDSTSETNATRNFTLGNMSVDLMNDFSEPINPGSTFDIQVNVTDNESAFEDQADVDFYFTNGSWTSEIYQINNLDDVNNDGEDDHYKNFGLNFDLKYASNYVLHINATEASAVGYENSYGAQSLAVETLSDIKGEIVRLNASSGCDIESFFGECERGATIDTAFNITSSSAENVNLSLELKNRNTGTWENWSTTRLVKENGIYAGEVSVPDINTSKYERKFRLRYNASKNGRTEIVDRVIDYKDFQISDKSNSVTAKGSYRVKLEIGKFFTPQLLTESRIENGTVSVDQPSGNTLTSFDVSDMDRMPDSGHFKKKISIPAGAEDGIYNLNVEVTNIYGTTKSETFSFNVTDVQKTFTLNDGDEDFERDITKTGLHYMYVPVEFDLDPRRTLNYSISDEIEDFTEVNYGENLQSGENCAAIDDDGDWQADSCTTQRVGLCEVDGDYELTSENRTWRGAQQACNDRDGELAVIDDSDENEQIADDYDTSLWIGYNDLEEEGSWGYPDDDETYTNWDNGEPSNSGIDSDEDPAEYPIIFNISEVDEYDGEIKFIEEETNYNSTLDVEIEHPSCSYRNGSVCIVGSDLNASSDETEDITKDFISINFGEKDSSYSYSFSLSGNITNYANLETEETTLNTENDSETVNLTYSVNAPGFYFGTLTIDNEEDTVEIPVSLDSNVEATSTTIAVPDSIELGEVQEGDSSSADIEIENTGDIEVTSIEASSDEYTVSADSVSIAPGSTETVSVDFSEITSESGELTVTAYTASDTTSGTVSVSADIIPDFGEKADEFEQRLIDLDSQVSSDSEQQTQLNDVQSSISDLRSAYRQGNYDRAQTMSTQIQNTLDTVEMEVESSQPDPSNPNPGQTEEGGGMPILPIAAAIFVILLVGFIAYSSIELEPGDPLYDVLG